MDLWRDLAAANGHSIQELNPWCFLTQDDCARLSACSSLAIPYLPDAGGDSAQPHEVARQDRRRWKHALKLLWDMRRFQKQLCRDWRLRLAD